MTLISAALLLVFLIVAPVYPQVQPPSRDALRQFCEPESSDKYAACSLMLRGGCQDDPAKPYCSTLSLSHALCHFDNPPGAPCAPYTQYCAANPQVCNLANNQAWPGWVRSVELQYQVYRMCSDHNMEGCDWCEKPATSPLTPVTQLDKCDSLNTYSAMCKSMPDMTACAFAWKPMCLSLPNSPLLFPNICSADALNDGDVDDGTGDPLRTDPATPDSSPSRTEPKKAYYSIPPMRMFFHQDMVDILLFRAWVTRTPFQYWMAALLVMFITFGFSAWVYLIRRKWIPAINKHLTQARYQSAYLPSTASAAVNVASQSSLETLPVNQMKRGFDPRYEALLAARSILLVIELMWSYVVMLIVMAYNWGWIGAFLLGAFLGNMVFNRDTPEPHNPAAANGEPRRVSEDGKDGLLRQATCC